MLKKNKERERKRKQEQWEKEAAQITFNQRFASRMKRDLRAKGCVLPFFEMMDSSEEEFHRVVEWAKSEFQTLHGVFEVDEAILDGSPDRHKLQVPEGWQQVIYQCEDEDLARSYKATDTPANIRGAATEFLDETGGVHTVIEVIRNPSCSFEHKEHKYNFKLPALLHEIGHVKDYEQQINFNRATRHIDLVEAEVYANVYALEGCFRRAYFTSGEMYFEALVKHKDDSGYLGEVVRRVLQRFQMPTYRKWTDYGN